MARKTATKTVPAAADGFADGLFDDPIFSPAPPLGGLHVPPFAADPADDAILAALLAPPPGHLTEPLAGSDPPDPGDLARAVTAAGQLTGDEQLCVQLLAASAGGDTPNSDALRALQHFLDAAAGPDPAREVPRVIGRWMDDRNRLTADLRTLGQARTPAAKPGVTLDDLYGMSWQDYAHRSGAGAAGPAGLAPLPPTAAARVERLGGDGPVDVASDAPLPLAADADGEAGRTVVLAADAYTAPLEAGDR